MTDSALRDAFRTAFGRDAAVARRAPGRVNLIGEHTDYNRGFVLPLAVQLDVRVAAARRSDGVLRVASRQVAGHSVEIDVSSLAPGSVAGWAAYVAGAAWSLRVHGTPVQGADVLVDGDVPAGAGLSSSAALECATVAALAALANVVLPPVTVALLAQQAENAFVGVPCGVMDQMASTCSRAGHALLLDTRSMSFERIPLELADHGLALLIVDTRVHHQLAGGEYAIRRNECQQAADVLGLSSLRDVDDLGDALARLEDDRLRRRVRHVVTENRRVVDVGDALRSGAIAVIGSLLTASHESLRDDFEVSCPELDLAVQSMIEAGALGARMTGGGFGGSAIGLVRLDAVDATSAAVKTAFARHLLAEPFTMLAVPSAGASPLTG